MKELIERLRKYTYWLGQSGPESKDMHPVICDEAADALEQVLTENQQLVTKCKQLEAQFNCQKDTAKYWHDRCDDLLEENAQLRRERDAAVADLKTVCAEVDAWECCSFCKKQFTNCEEGCNFEWRGVVKENEA